MRVLLATAEYPPARSGGIGIFYRELGRELVAQGAQTCIVAADPEASKPSRNMEDGVEVRRAPLRAFQAMRLGRWRLDPSAVRRARALSAAARSAVREFRPDIVETHDWAAPLWRTPARPFVVRLHGASSVLAAGRGKRPERLMRLLEGRLLKQADRRVAVSEWVRGRSAELFGSPIETLIPNGVDTNVFRPGEARRDEEIVYAGALREDKGVVELLHALEIVFRERPRARATLAGAPDAWRELAPAVRRQVERLQLVAPDRLRLLGFVARERLLELYRRAGACVFPSHVEAFGLACVEAMSCGAAVVASRLGAAAEIVEDRCGLLVDPRTPQPIANALLRLLRNPAEAHALGRRARELVVERYSLRSTAVRTLELYAELRRTKPCLSQPAA